MKKLILSCAAAVAMFAMVACGGDNKSKMIDIYKDGAEKLEAAKGDPTKKLEVINEVNEKIEKMELKPEELRELLEDKEVQEAGNSFNKAAMPGK